MELVDFILFNDALRLFLLRTTIAASLGVVITLGTRLASGIWYFDDGTLMILPLMLFIFTIVHHLMSVGNWVYFYGIVDLALILFEVGAVIYLSTTVSIFTGGLMYSIFLPVLLWISAGCLTSLLILRFATVFRFPKTLFGPFDILPPTTSSPKPTTWGKLFGRSIWREQFVGEACLTRGLRGVFGTTLLGGIAINALFAIVVEPLRETGFLPIKESRAPYRAFISVEDVVWNIIPIIVSRSDVNATEIMLDSIRVAPIFDKEDNAQVNELNPCTTFLDEDMPLYPGFQCKPSTSSPPDTIGEFVETIPDILITVNFTALGANLQPGFFAPRRPLITLLLSMGNQTNIETQDLVERATPFTLIPGINIVGAVSLVSRRFFSRPSSAAFGLFQTLKEFGALHLTIVYPDPSSTIPRAENITTLRLLLQDSFSREIRIITDTRDKSVLAGFSAVGGLWITLNGIFSLLFGSSLFYILYGSKPLAIFGLAHSFQRQQIKKEYQRKYPHIANEQQDPKTRGLVALLRDRLIDLSILEEKPGPSEAVTPEEIIPQDIESSGKDKIVGETDNLLPSDPS
ncbi:hypothetical protein GALMADRAFT_257714 [Galerina marginata CBS 339.88]|uniref:Uncharacterized protein n=1 Tax=Galerina marginata (strain CBS 339.88) TaxID=685588 RepID=A0A067SCZ9_GALM3|nr:hypothetical protein GALMADRAFT_257714 [Galerina marginata CBS 339.88]